MKKVLLTLLLGVTTLTTFAQVPSYVPTNGLVGWWPFNGNADDESGNGNNGTVTGATLTTDRNGVANKAYSFNGTNNKIFIEKTLLSNTFSSHTTSVWINTSSQTNQTIYSDRGVNGGNPNYYWYKNNSSIQTQWNGGWNHASHNNNCVNGAISQQSVWNGQWHNLVSVFDAQSLTINLYQDGILIKTQPNITLNCYGNVSQPTTIGCSSGGGYPDDYFFNGKIDDIAIYNRALTQQEITALYNSCSTPTASITPQGNTTFCQGGSVVLNASTGTGYTYEWYKDGSIITGATASSYSATQSGNYTLKVINGSCNATSSATAVTVNPNPTATITAGGATTFCQGGSVTLTASSATNNTYQWYNNGNSISNATSSVYSATQSGNYTVKVTNGACNATSSATAVTVNSNPTVTLTGLNSVVYKTSLPVQLVGNPSGGTYSGETVSGSTFTPANATLGKKTIGYNYTTPQGCSGSASQTTIVADTVGNVCSTYDTLKIKVQFTAGLYANTTNTIKFFPNPTKDILFIDNGNYQAMNGYKIKIVTLAGAIVYNQPITSQQVQISMNQFGAKGIYIAQILDSNNTIVDSKKIVLE